MKVGNQSIHTMLPPIGTKISYVTGSSSSRAIEQPRLSAPVTRTFKLEFDPYVRAPYDLLEGWLVEAARKAGIDVQDNRQLGFSFGGFGTNKTQITVRAPIEKIREFLSPTNRERLHVDKILEGSLD
jgi:hypothetical protein